MTTSVRGCCILFGALNFIYSAIIMMENGTKIYIHILFSNTRGVDIRHDQTKPAKERATRIPPDKPPATERNGVTDAKQGWRTAAGSNSWPKG